MEVNNMGAGEHGGFGNTKGREYFLQEKYNYINPLNGKKEFIPKNTTFSNKPKAIAGSGSKTPIREINNLVKNYGGSKDDWTKKVANIKTNKYIYDIHWYQKDGK